MNTFQIKEITLHLGQTKNITSRNSYLLFVFNCTCNVTLLGTEHMVAPSDLVFIKPGQMVSLLNRFNNDKQSVVFLDLPENILKNYIQLEPEIIDYFQNIPFDQGVIHSDQKSIVLIKNLFHKITILEHDELLIAKNLYQTSLFLSIISVFLRLQSNSDDNRTGKSENAFAIDRLFQYISHHLSEDLSLQRLEQEFYLSGSHICREFKKATGITLHNYITNMRIDLAKEYLLSGKNVQQLYTLCGFQSYNHFFKTFKARCRMTPKEYQLKMLKGK